MPKQPVISFRVDPETYSIVERMAASRNESIGGFAKQKLLEGMGESAPQHLDIEQVLEQFDVLKVRLSKGIELLARLASRDNPNVRTKAEDSIAEWARREIPR